MRKPTWILVAMALAVILILSACAKQEPSQTPTTQPSTVTAMPTTTQRASPTPTVTQAATPRYGGVYRRTHTVPPRTLFPADSPSVMSPAGDVLYNYILATDEKGEKLYPQLATEWKLSPDSKSLTLTLRKGVKFHDGTDFNAAAVKWNMEKRKAAKLGDYEEVTSFDVVDDYTIRLNLSKYLNTSMVALWFTGGQIYSPTAYQKNGADWAMWNPVGTGPFKFVRYDKDQLLKSMRFDGYWEKGKPYLDAYDVYYFADMTILAMAFLKGDIDYVGNVDAAAANELLRAGYKVYGEPSTIGCLYPDSANATSPFAKQKVREAVEYALDRPGVAKALGYGLWKPANQISYTSYAYIPDLKGREFNPAKAKQLLSEAGYPNGFKAAIFSGSQPMREALIAFATNLKDVGIDTTLTQVDRGRLTQLQLGGWTNGFIFRPLQEEPDWLQQVYKDLSTAAAIQVSIQRPAGWDEALEQAMSAPDAATRTARAQQVVRKAFDEAMVVPLVLYSGLNFTKDYVHTEFPGNGGRLTGRPADVWLSK